MGIIFRFLARQSVNSNTNRFPTGSGAQRRLRHCPTESCPPGWIDEEPRTINESLLQRLSAVLSILNLHALDARIRSPADAAFRTIVELTPRDSSEDKPPEGLLSDAQQPLPTYTTMLLRIVEEANETVNEKTVPADQHYKALLEEMIGHAQNIESKLEKSVVELHELESNINKGSRTTASTRFNAPAAMQSWSREEET